MTSRLILRIGLTLAISCSLFGQTGVEKMTDIDNSAMGLLQRADAVFQERDYESALGIYHQAVEQARTEFNQSVEVEALSQVGRMNLLLDNREAGREALAEAETKAAESDAAGWSRYLGVRGRFEWKDGDLDRARKTFEEMYTYCSTNNLAGRAIDAAHMVAIVAPSPEEQVRWSRFAIEAAEKSGEESWLGPLWNNLACTYYDGKQFDNALECFLKARDYHWRFSGEVARLFADYHVGMAYRNLGRLDEAEKWLRPVLAWGERLENHSAIGQACQDLGEIALARNNREEGLALLKRALEEYRIDGWDTAAPQIYDDLKARIAGLE
jgi:tetratricopeptide (TPR) repeat protein